MIPEVTTVKPLKVHLLRITSNFPPEYHGGAGNHILELAQHIDPYLQDQVVIAPHCGKKCIEYDKQLNIQVIRVKSLVLWDRYKIPLPKVIINGLSFFWALTKRNKPDIIHTHGISTNAVGVLLGKLWRVPVVTMLHGSQGVNSKAEGIYETILALLFPPDQAIILDDGTGAVEKFNKLWRNRTTTVYHAIDESCFKPMEKNAELLATLGIKSDTFVILSTSRLTRWKNVDYAIEVFKIFLETNKCSSAILLVAGEGDLKENLVNLVSNLSLQQNVKFVGSVPFMEMPKFLSIADIVISTSVYSNMGRNIQEAMACGKPIISFNTPGMDKVIQNMDNGILVTPGNLEEFARMISLLQDHPEVALKIGQKGCEFIKKERSWNSRVQQELNVYESIMNKKGF